MHFVFKLTTLKGCSYDQDGNQGDINSTPASKEKKPDTLWTQNIG